MYNKLFAFCVVLALSLMLYLKFAEITGLSPGEEGYRSVAYTGTLPVSTSFYENRVALTFDDGPHRVNTVKLLDGLKERNVKATFFVVGELAAENEEIIKRMSEEGHLIGNHTYTHANLSLVGSACGTLEISKTNDLIYSLTGKEIKYVRPPYGQYTEELEDNFELTTVLWSIDPKDWEIKNTEEIVKAVVDNVKDGDIVLLHDIYATSVAAALEIIDELKYRGYIFVTVEEILLD